MTGAQPYLLYSHASGTWSRVVFDMEKLQKGLRARNQLKDAAVREKVRPSCDPASLLRRRNPVMHSFTMYAAFGAHNLCSLDSSNGSLLG